MERDADQCRAWRARSRSRGGCAGEHDDRAGDGTHHFEVKVPAAGIPETASASTSAAPRDGFVANRAMIARRSSSGRGTARKRYRHPNPGGVVRSGGGRSGEVFQLQGERTSVGRSPDCDIFLDDVTVSRRHALITEEGGRFTIEDLGSLNGTFLNRHRIEQAPLTDDDEVQIGKYRLVFLAR